MKSVASNPYWRLMRLHQPAGIALLLWPCWWSVAIASFPAYPSLRLLALFGLGAIVMRAAGCIINDWADRNFDRAVERTKHRPLASGELQPRHAAWLLAPLLVIALIVTLQMPPAVLGLALASLPFVAAYPFMKRFTWWPQLFLGLTFNFGAWMGWAAVHNALAWPAAWLYLAGIFWTLGYDTIYAHQDKTDDARIGVKSTALHLGAVTKSWVGFFYSVALIAFAMAGFSAGLFLPYYLAVIAAGLHFLWQINAVVLDDPVSCFNVFRSNVAFGWIPFLGILVAAMTT